MRYCISVDELQQLNTEVPIEGHEIEWANDCVTCGEVEEFSQHWIAENIIDTEIVDEEQMLNKFDADNDYLSDWTREKKLEYVRNWKSSV
jgi:hypothetical protein